MLKTYFRAGVLALMPLSQPAHSDIGSFIAGQIIGGAIQQNSNNLLQKYRIINVKPISLDITNAIGTYGVLRDGFLASVAQMPDLKIMNGKTGTFDYGYTKFQTGLMKVFCGESSSIIQFPLPDRAIKPNSVQIELKRPCVLKKLP